MMNRRILLAVTAAATILSSSAQINSPSGKVPVGRGIQMYKDANYNGCLDQLLQMRQLEPDAAQSEEALYYIAMSTLSLGDDEALSMLNAFMALFPQSIHRAEVLKAIGDYYFDQGGSMYGKAITSYLKVDPRCLDENDRLDYTYRLAYSYLMLADYDKAGELFNQLKGTKRYGNAARFYEAYIAYSRQDYPLALQLFKLVDTSTEPGNTADYYLAQLYYREGNYAKALQSARTVIAANPVPEFTIEARRIAGESLYKTGDAAAAVPYLWEYVATAAEPKPSAYYILGVEEFNGRNYKAAIKLLQKAVDSPDAMGQNAYLYLGQAYLKDGNSRNALMAFENAYRMNYDAKVQETAFYNYAVALSEGGRTPFTSTVSVFEDFLQRYPSSRYASAVSRHLVTGYMLDDNYDKALESINKVTNPSAELLAAKQRVLFSMGVKEYNSGNTSRAMSRMEQARAIDANDDIANQALMWIGDCYYRDRDWDSAAMTYLEFLDKVPADDPNRRLCLYDLGYTRYNQRDYHKALLNFQRALDASGDIAQASISDIHDRMGDCYYARSEFAKAADQYQAAYNLNKESADYALYQLARMKGFQGDHSGEVSLLDDLINRFPSSGLVPAALLAKAESYIAMGDTQGAITTYNQLVRDFPSSTHGRNGMLQLAATYLNQGDTDNAITTYRQVIYTYPTSDEARVAADDLKHIYARQGDINEFVNFMTSVPNAPEINTGELEQLTYEVAEEDYLDGRGTAKLVTYVEEYPTGTYMPEALYYLAEDALDNGHYDEAYEYVTTVTMNYPDSEMAEHALALKGECELMEGKGEIALATFRDLEQKASTPAMLHQARMQVMRISNDLSRNGDVIAEADKLLASSAVGNPDNDEIHYMRALALSRMGNHAEAEEEWLELIDEPDTEWGARSAYNLARQQYDLKELDKAEDTITAFLDSDSSQDYWRARSVILLSDILRRQGNTFEANEYLKALRTNYTGTEPDIFNLINERLK